LSDSDSHALVADFSNGVPAWVEELLRASDLIVTLGCKLTHNGSAGGRLVLPADKLVRVDASAAVLAANYPAHWPVCGRVEDFVAALLAADLPASDWTAGEIATLKGQSERWRRHPMESEPAIEAPTLKTAPALFAAIADMFGDDVVYTADAGLHQALVRRYALVSRPRGLLCPTDFQSMGFGLPGAIGAARACPGSKIIACVGDGALILSLGDLLTAARERIDLVVLVFNDGAYGLIQQQQLRTFGHEHATTLLSPDYSTLAAALDAAYFSLAEDDAGALSAAVATRGLRLVEVRISLPGSLRWSAAQRAVAEGIVRRLPPPAIQWARRVLRRSQ
jgi:acetolactate synthase-1/2/3 large subunit